MVRRTLTLVVTLTAALSSTLAVAPTATAAKATGELRVCGKGALMDVFVDRGRLHREKRDLAAGKCAKFAVPRGKYAVTVVGRCENNRDSTLEDLAVTPQNRGLYQGEHLAGARVVRNSTTTFTATWSCLGVTAAEPDPGTSPPPFA